MIRNWLVVGCSVVGYFLGVFPLLASLGMIGIAIFYNENEPKIVKRINEMLRVIVPKDKKIPRVLKFNQRDYGLDVILDVPAGFSTDDLDKNKKDIEQNLNCETQVTYDNGTIKLKVMTNKFKQEYPFEIVKCKKEQELFIGYSRQGKEIIDLTVTPHILCGGTTRSGKTVSFKGILSNAILTKKRWEFIIGDFKGSEFVEFAASSKVRKFFTEPEQTNEILNELLNEMQTRNKIFTENGVVNFVDYNALGKKMNRIIFFMDEFADIATNDELMNKLNKLLRKAGSCGINIFLATQKPTADSCPTALKSNMDCRLCFRVTDMQNMRTILDTGELEKINAQGRAYLKYDTIKEIQCMYLKDVKEAIKHTYIDKTKKEIKKQTGVVRHDFNRQG